MSESKIKASTLPRSSTQPQRLFLVSTTLFLIIFYFSHSYVLFNVNHYKIAVALIALTALFATSIAKLIFLDRKASSAQHKSSQLPLNRIPLSLFIILLAPLLLCLPGYIINGGNYNYFFAQEVVTYLIVASWFIYLVYQVKTEKTLLWFLICCAGIAFTISTVGIVSSYVLNSQDPFSYGAIAAFGNRNYLAGFLTIQIPIYLILTFQSFDRLTDSVKKQRFIRVIFGTTTLFCFITLATTQARTASAALLFAFAILALSIFFWPHWFRVRRKFVFYLLIITLAIGAIAVATLPIIEFIQRRLETGVGLQSRYIPWAAAWQSIKEAPLFGWGPGSSYNLFFEYVDPKSRLYTFERSYVHPHSDYLEILQEGGIAGAIGYFLFWGYFISIAIKILRSEKTEHLYKQLTVGILLGLLTFHIVALLSVAPRMITVKLSYMTSLAILFLIYIPIQSEQCTTLEQRISWKKAVLFSTGLLIVLAACLYYPDGKGRLLFTNALYNLKGQPQLDALEKLRDSHPNAYALEKTVNKEIRNRRYSELAKTFTVMDETLPKFRTIDYKKAKAAFLQRDYKRARTLALAYQQRDLYYYRNNELLAKLAVLSNDSKLFYKQLQIMITYKLIFMEVFEHYSPRPTQLQHAEQIKYFIHKKRSSWVDESDQIINIHLNKKFVVDSIHYLKRLYQRKTRGNEKANYTENLNAQLDSILQSDHIKKEVVKEAVRKVFSDLTLKRI